MGTMLKIDDINVYYGAIHAIKGISLEVNEGEIVTLIGANGAGKSTTLRTISGLLKPKTGTMTFEGKNIAGVPAHNIVKAGISQVPEGRRIFAEMSVMENLDLGAFIRKDKDGIQKDLKMVFERFPRLEERKNQEAGTLSGGEQQMLAMGRALMSHPKLMMLDEPFTGLDPKASHLLKGLMREICDQGGAIFFSTHVLEVAEKLCDKVAIIRKGKLVISGSMAEVKGADSLEEVFLELEEQHA